MYYSEFLWLKVAEMQLKSASANTLGWVVISYPLLHNKSPNYPKLSSLRLLFRTVSVNQDFGSDLSGSFASGSLMKLKSRCQLTSITERLVWGWRTHFPGGSLTWLLAGDLTILPHGFLHRAAGVFSQYVGWFSLDGAIQASKAEAGWYNLWLELRYLWVGGGGW